MTLSGRNRLDRLRDEADPRRRRLLALGLLTARLAPSGIEPILVGGGALEFYTAGGYATHDMDLALPHGPDVDAAFAEMGFRKEGRFWYHADLDLLFESRRRRRPVCPGRTRREPKSSSTVCAS